MPSILVVSANVFLKGWRLAGMIKTPGAWCDYTAQMVGLSFFFALRHVRKRAGLPAPKRRTDAVGFLGGDWR